MSNYVPTLLSVLDNRKLTTSGSGHNKRYFCDGAEIGKETFDMILANRSKRPQDGRKVSKRELLPTHELSG
jgi:hypothetical protein